MTRLHATILLAAILLATSVLGCGPKEAATPPPEDKVEPTPATPEERALSNIVAWRGAIAGWVPHNSAPFASEGHETARTDWKAQTASPDAHESASYAEGDALALVAYGEGDGSEPAQLWFMVKMAQGFDPEGHDWFFAHIDAEGTVVVAGPASDPVVAEACGNCHKVGAGGTDFVFGAP